MRQVDELLRPYKHPLRTSLAIAVVGSWHCCPSMAPRFAFVPMHGDLPAKARAGAGSTRWSVRFTGIAVGPQGSLFVADDEHGAIYRIRPQ
jgi:glucose/arabinose dehydrogenase